MLQIILVAGVQILVVEVVKQLQQYLQHLRIPTSIDHLLQHPRGEVLEVVVHLVAHLDDLGVEGVAPRQVGVLVSDVLQELEHGADEGWILGVVEEVGEELGPAVGEEDVCEVDEARAEGFGDLLGEVEVGMER